MYRDSAEFKLLCAKTEDLFARATGEPVATPFLTPAEQYFLASYLRERGMQDRALFFGGAPGAKRQKLFVLPEYICALAQGGDLYGTTVSFLGEDAFSEICPIKVAGGGFRALSHRDYLGGLLSLGIDRAVIGDIAPIDEYSAYVFVDCKIVGFLTESEVRIASDRVKITRANLPDGYEIVQKMQAMSDTVASARLDCVIAALCHLSREAAQNKIKIGDVERNYETATETDIAVQAEDTISVRGVGKFTVRALSDLTKKGRYRLLADKYI